MIAKEMSPTNRYIIMPMKGLRSPRSVSTASFFVSMPRTSQMAPASAAVGQTLMNVLDELGEDGSKLIEATDEQLVAIRGQAPGLRIVPEVFYHSARAPQHAASAVSVAAAKSQPALKLKINVKDSNGKPVTGAKVVAFTDFATKQGAQGTTDTHGNVSLTCGTVAALLERVYIYPTCSQWPTVRLNLPVARAIKLVLKPIDLSAPDLLTALYGACSLTGGQSVKVGVIDTGIALAHPDLTVSGGQNTVVGEAPTAFGDNGGEGHGTHCAGIVAGHGASPTGVRGLAPGVELLSFRVFPQVVPGIQAAPASNYSIMKAIDAGIQAGCHLLSLSLAGPTQDEATAAAITEAWDAGCVCIVAAGNDGRGPVGFPARDSGAIAVSAMGRETLFPSDSTDAEEIVRPPASAVDPADFIAGFSDFGPQIAFTAPGVGIVSCVPPDRFAVMSGTSMACPAVAGYIATLISGPIAAMPPDANRSAAIVQAAVAAAKPQGFGPTYEGHGPLT